jgi:glucokinase
VSLETVLSGPGLENLYAALSGGGALPAAEITARALAGGDEIAGRTVDRFLAFLGSAAGDLALAFGARGGVFISGGIVPRLVAAIAGSRFHARFVDNRRFHGYLAAIPVAVVTRKEPAFVGLARLLREIEEA